jgi:hypothetical protein
LQPLERGLCCRFPCYAKQAKYSAVPAALPWFAINWCDCVVSRYEARRVQRTSKPAFFRQTLVDHLSAQAQGAVQAAHRALVAGIQALAPPLANGSGSTDLNNGIQRYAFEREAEPYGCWAKLTGLWQA